MQRRKKVDISREWGEVKNETYLNIKCSGVTRQKKQVGSREGPVPPRKVIGQSFYRLKKKNTEKKGKVIGSQSIFLETKTIRGT